MKTLHREQIYLKPGEVVVTRKPALVTTLLGSCVAVTMFEPNSGDVYLKRMRACKRTGNEVVR